MDDWVVGISGHQVIAEFQARGQDHGEWRDIQSVPVMEPDSQRYRKRKIWPCCRRDLNSRSLVRSLQIEFWSTKIPNGTKIRRPLSFRNVLPTQTWTRLETAQSWRRHTWRGYIPLQLYAMPSCLGRRIEKRNLIMGSVRGDHIDGPGCEWRTV